MNFWNQNFSAPGYKYGTEPNAFLVSHAHLLHPAADVLVPGDGEGRNGVWLAQQGHRVTSADASTVGLQKALALAAQRGVWLTTLCVDLADWIPAAGSVDAVILTFVHLPAAIRAAAHQRLAAALRPGGLLLLEAFHPEQLAHNSGGPKAPDLLYTPQTLQHDFADKLTETLAWHGQVSLDEGPGHQGLAHVTRWIGRAGMGPGYSAGLRGE